MLRCVFVCCVVVGFVVFTVVCCVGPGFEFKDFELLRNTDNASRLDKAIHDFI